MKKNVYVVRDIAAKLYHQPVLSDTDVTALRSFSMACKNPDSFLAKFPADHELWRVGTFDLESGLLEAIVPGVLVARASDFVQPSVEEVKK